MHAVIVPEGTSYLEFFFFSFFDHVVPRGLRYEIAN